MKQNLKTNYWLKKLSSRKKCCNIDLFLSVQASLGLFWQLICLVYLMCGLPQRLFLFIYFFSLSGSYLPVSLYASWVFCWNLDNWMLWYGKFGNKILLPWGLLFSIVDGCNHLFNFYFKLFLQWLCFLSCVFSEVSSFSCIQEVFWQRFSRT